MIAAAVLLWAWPAGAADLSPAQKRRALALISVFENGTALPQYGYAEALGDGRGLTVGLGLTTATGDALEAARRYGRAPLARFIPELERLAARHDPSTSTLAGFSRAWREAARDPAFRAAQDEVQDERSYRPARELATRLGLRAPLSLAALYDAFWMHGGGDDPDGAPALAAAASRSAGAGDERAWLAAFLRARRADMLAPADRATAAVWAESVGRVEVWADLLASGNLAFEGPIVVGRGYRATVP